MRISYNHELYKLYDEPDISALEKAGRLRQLGHLHRTSKTDPHEKLTFTKVEGIKRWLDNAEQELSKPESGRRRRR
jgi:hypothetical protein